MTVAELITKLREFPPDLKVEVGNDEFHCYYCQGWGENLTVELRKYEGQASTVDIRFK